jgi:predicted nucleic acid-binding protein
VALVLDTGPLLAALDSADPDHESCAALLTEGEEDLLVPALVLGELDYWCAERLNPGVWLAFLDDVHATLDHRHFSVMRPAHVDALRLLP